MVLLVYFSLQCQGLYFTKCSSSWLHLLYEVLAPFSYFAHLDHIPCIAWGNARLSGIHERSPIISICSLPIPSDTNMSLSLRVFTELFWTLAVQAEQKKKNTPPLYTIKRRSMLLIRRWHFLIFPPWPSICFAGPLKSPSRQYFKLTEPSLQEETLARLINALINDPTQLSSHLWCCVALQQDHFMEVSHSSLPRQRDSRDCFPPCARWNA